MSNKKDQDKKKDENQEKKIPSGGQSVVDNQESSENRHKKSEGLELDQTGYGNRTTD